MTDHRTQRRLSAILAADVASYTQLVEQDTDGTVAAWTAARDDVIQPAMSTYSGRMVKLTGDGFLGEFSSIQDAVACALDIQKALAGSRLRFRMGVHLGDVVDDGQDIHGEGVNIAARIEALADAGGISVSGSVFEQVRNRVEARFEDQGEHEVKHVSAKVRVYRILTDAVTDAQAGEAGEALALALPEKPSIVVLPFENISADPEQEYFADGITEDLISALSQLRWLFVIARNSSFSYKGTSPDLDAVSKELGVKYVLSGSVRRAGVRVRVTPQLVDATTGNQLWAQRLDGEAEDLFDLQDELTAKIVTAIGPEMTLAEIDRGRRSKPNSFDVWDSYLQALPRFYATTQEDFEFAIERLRSCIEHDPEYSNAYALLGHIFAVASHHGWFGRVGDSLERGMGYARQAIRIDPLNALGHAAIGMCHHVRGPMDDAAAAFRRALELEPNNAMYRSRLASALGFAGETGAASEAIALAERGSPRDPDRWHINLAKANVNFAADRLEEAFAAAKDVIRSQPNHYGGYSFTAASAALLGKDDEARVAVEGLLERAPRFTLTAARKNPMFERPEDAARMIEGLRAAGVPE